MIVFKGEQNFCQEKKVGEVAKTFMALFGIPTSG
jgi:hypothetical protein